MSPRPTPSPVPPSSSPHFPSSKPLNKKSSIPHLHSSPSRSSTDNVLTLSMLQSEIRAFLSHIETLRLTSTLERLRSRLVTLKLQLKRSSSSRVTPDLSSTDQDLLQTHVSFIRSVLHSLESGKRVRRSSLRTRARIRAALAHTDELVNVLHDCGVVSIDNNNNGVGGRAAQMNQFRMPEIMTKKKSMETKSELAKSVKHMMLHGDGDDTYIDENSHIKFSLHTQNTTQNGGGGGGRGRHTSIKEDGGALMNLRMLGNDRKVEEDPFLQNQNVRRRTRSKLVVRTTNRSEPPCYNDLNTNINNTTLKTKNNDDNNDDDYIDDGHSAIDFKSDTFNMQWCFNVSDYDDPISHLDSTYPNYSPHPDAVHHFSQALHYKRSNPAQSNYYMQLAARLGHPAARLRLATCISDIRLVARTGYPQAEVELALRLLHDNVRSSRLHDDEATDLLMSATCAGYALGTLNLGVAYMLGRGVERSRVRAAYMFRTAAFHGDSRGFVLLGKVTDNVIWFVRAATTVISDGDKHRDKKEENGHGGHMEFEEYLAAHVMDWMERNGKIASKRDIQKARDLVEKAKAKGVDVEKKTDVATTWKFLE